MLSCGEALLGEIVDGLETPSKADEFWFGDEGDTAGRDCRGGRRVWTRWTGSEGLFADIALDVIRLP